MTTPVCPACGEQIETYQWVDSVTVELLPCGHQVDEWVFNDLDVEE